MFQLLIEKFFNMPRIYKHILAILIDCHFIVAATFLSLIIRSELANWVSMTLYYTIALTAVVTIIIWIKLGLYRAVIRYIDTKALSTIFIGCVMSGLAMVIIAYLMKTPMPRSLPFIYVWVLLILVGGSRLVIRGLINAQNIKAKNSVIIYGAGASGRQLALSLQHGPEYNPVAFVDDNLELQKVVVAGLKVYPKEKLAELIAKNDVSKILLAIPSASANQRRKLLDLLESHPIEVLTIPGSADLVSGKLKIDTLRKVDIADLLGRETVKPIDRLFRRCIENKNVMVTGAGGSIGSELCRQIVKQSPLSLILFESSEFNLYNIESELKSFMAKHKRNIKVVPILGNVADEVTVENVINNFDVNTIYHAAAYKHVPIVEHNVVSGIRNNVWGTKICAETALRCGVEYFVLISTDKAVRPTNVMGATKRLAELVLQALNAKQRKMESEQKAGMVLKTHFSMVRFGNVLGSSGSVVPLFQKQIAEGGPVTITHPDITRYFMTIPEAAQLVIQAGAMGSGGEVYVLDMGKPVKINELAFKMVRLTGLSVKNEDSPEGDIEVTYTGLRPGEKLYEELLIGENVEGTEHQRIMKAKELSISWQDLQTLLNKLNGLMAANDIAQIREVLLQAPLGYNPLSDIADCVWLEGAKPMSNQGNKQEGLRVVPKQAL